MKELLVQYALYNLWANKTLTDLILTLPEEQQKQPVESSFPGLYPTVMHMLLAESIWWQRVNLREKIIFPNETDFPDMKDAVKGLVDQSAQWEEWVSDSSEMMLSQVYAYQNSKKEQFKQPVSETVLHVCNHSTYHRGQLVTIMRTLGIKTIPQTDFAIFTRKKES